MSSRRRTRRSRRPAAAENGSGRSSSGCRSDSSRPKGRASARWSTARSSSARWRQGVLVLGWIICIHLLEANLLNPKIMGDAAKIHPVLVVFALIAGEHSYGLVGALFAVPVASIIQTIFMYYRKRPRPPTTASVV